MSAYSPAPLESLSDDAPLPPVPLTPFRSAPPPPSSIPTSTAPSSSSRSANLTIPTAPGKENEPPSRRRYSASSAPSHLAFALASSGLALSAPSAPADSLPSISKQGAAPWAAPGHLHAGHTPSSTSESAYSDGEDSDALGSDSSDGDDLSSNTRYALAGAKRNADFHDLFPEVEDDDYLIEEYGCALHREILIQGKLYVSENNLSFHANVFGWQTNLVIPFSDVAALEKRMTAYVIPNAIMVTTTSDVKHTFATFLARDPSFDLISNIWRMSKPVGRSRATSMHESSILEEDEAAMETYDAAMDEMLEKESRASSPQDESTTQRARLMTAEELAVANALISTAAAPPPHRRAPPPPPRIKRARAKRRAPTQCACGKAKEHFSEVAGEYVLPGTPESIYNLMFTSGFAKDFMINEQAVMDLQMSDWAPESPGSKLLCRNVSYIKPLTGSFGPKQCKCEAREETLHVDFDDYVTTMTTTRTPDVPSGGVFSVKTRTCIMWAGPASTKVLVTMAVEWTGRSFIKSIIERSAMDGQRTYQRDLEPAMRAYIADHIGEFIPEGLDEPTPLTPAAADPTASAATPAAAAAVAKSTESELAKREGQRGLQWILDTATGASTVGWQSFWGAIDLVGDVVEDWNWTVVLVFVVLALVASNAWTLFTLNRTQAGQTADFGRIDVGRREGAWRDQRVVKVATDAVQAFMEGQSRTQAHVPAEERKLEVEALYRALEDMKDRVGAMKAQVREPDR